MSASHNPGFSQNWLNCSLPRLPTFILGHFLLFWSNMSWWSSKTLVPPESCIIIRLVMISLSSHQKYPNLAACLIQMFIKTKCDKNVPVLYLQGTDQPWEDGIRNKLWGWTWQYQMASLSLVRDIFRTTTQLQPWHGVSMHYLILSPKG